MSDAYEDAIRRLRCQASPAADDGEATRRRIAASLQARRPQRSVVVFAMAACLLGGTALAFYRSQRQPDAAPVALAKREERLTKRAPSESASTAPLPAEAPPVRAAQTAQVEASIVTRPQPRRRTRQPSAPTPTTALNPASTQAPEAASTALPKLDPQVLHAAYMEAHRRQFRGDPRAALVAWDAFLAQQPSGALAIEARYYRAITLLRLGQREQGMRELAPYARGDFGDFRRSEARRMIEQLGMAAPAAPR